jgi:hypothetical protein
MMIAYGTPDFPLEPMATASQLAGFRGGPFTDAVVTSAGESIRDECGWHIAPEVTDTMKFRGEGTVLLLPTLRLLDVTLIRDRNGYPVTGVDWYENGVLECEAGFPTYVEVTFKHGYSTCPPSLLPVIAERAQASAAGRVKSESLAGRSVSLEGGYDPNTPNVLTAYRLGAS